MDTLNIESFMKNWKDLTNTDSLDTLLTEFSNGGHWPTGNNKAGDLVAMDYVEKVNTCIGLILHAHATECIDGKWKIVPLRALPPGKSWEDVIRFDPLAQFLHISIEDAYNIMFGKGLAMSCH